MTDPDPMIEASRSVIDRFIGEALIHAAREIAVGSKLGIDATKLLGEGFKCPWLPLIKMDESVKIRVAKILNL